ncbi:MAG TPA: beta-lactamase family protein [Aliicoccus persicus]|uniref:Beta-lactamase family protein n=1 Tax=Aliicoccus persicus TaxID=930138 RepID=A0A921JC83_9STAP|nr:beta-lactamase family protein [Aliicoccus persicus]
MKNLLRTLSLLILLLVSTSLIHVKTFANTLPSGTSFEDIGEEIEDFVAANDEELAGMAVSVFNSDGVIYENYFGYQDLEAEILVEEDTVFEWGSVGKIMVWVAMMQLYEDGLVDFDADIMTYLPDLSDNPSVRIH